jgi:hypothetical protein
VQHRKTLRASAPTRLRPQSTVGRTFSVVNELSVWLSILVDLAILHNDKKIPIGVRDEPDVFQRGARPEKGRMQQESSPTVPEPDLAGKLRSKVLPTPTTGIAFVCAARPSALIQTYSMAVRY